MPWHEPFAFESKKWYTSERGCVSDFGEGKVTGCECKARTWHRLCCSDLLGPWAGWDLQSQLSWLRLFLGTVSTGETTLGTRVSSFGLSSFFSSFLGSSEPPLSSPLSLLELLDSSSSESVSQASSSSAIESWKTSWRKDHTIHVRKIIPFWLKSKHCSPVSFSVAHAGELPSPCGPFLGASASPSRWPGPLLPEKSWRGCVVGTGIVFMLENKNTHHIQ